ncbi:hypothetical protein ACFFX0_21345 [Citricoccus parietis]|uniref:Uncharacterized protein n=1 Tax=Citricoccus parietis TaxID=592307 RepID=A0ABV5G568_9MICC
MDGPVGPLQGALGHATHGIHQDCTRPGFQDRSVGREGKNEIQLQFSGDDPVQVGRRGMDRGRQRVVHDHGGREAGGAPVGVQGPDAGRQGPGPFRCAVVLRPLELDAHQLLGPAQRLLRARRGGRRAQWLTGGGGFLVGGS